MKKVIIILVGMFSLLLTGCTGSKELIDISYDELATKIENKDSFVLYVGSSDCSHCSEFRPVLEEVITENKLDVYYINMAKLSKSKYNAVMRKIDGRGTPTVVYLEKGKTKTSPRLEGARNEEATIDFFKEINYIKGE